MQGLRWSRDHHPRGLGVSRAGPPPTPLSGLGRAGPTPSPVYKSALHALTSELFAGAPSRAPRWSSSLAALALSLVTRSTHTEVGALARQLIGSITPWLTSV